MSLGVFRGKESSNRIELSRLVQDLLNFGVWGSLQLWGWGGFVDGGGWGCPPHMCTCMHIYMLNMIISIANGSPHWGNPWEFPMMSYTCVCVHGCVCVCVHMCGGTLSPPPSPSTHPLPPPSTPTPIQPTPRGDPRNQS